MLATNVLWLALSGVAPTPSHYKYNKTFHSAADFPQENPEVAIEANRCCKQYFYQIFPFVRLRASINGTLFPSSTLQTKL